MISCKMSKKDSVIMSAHIPAVDLSWDVSCLLICSILSLRELIEVGIKFESPDISGRMPWIFYLAGGVPFSTVQHAGLFLGQDLAHGVPQRSALVVAEVGDFPWLNPPLNLLGNPPMVEHTGIWWNTTLSYIWVNYNDLTATSLES